MGSPLIRARGDVRDGDAGLTIVELMVAVLVFAIFMTVIVSSIIGVTKATTRTQVVSNSSSQVLNAFQSMDRTVRYANAINFPGTGSSGARYIEYQTSAASAPSGVLTCNQWRFVPSTGTLSIRQWAAASSPGTTWQILTTNLNDLGGTYPFAMLPAQGNTQQQQLVLTIDVGNANAKGTKITTTFVARNSSSSSVSNVGTGNPLVSTTPVCGMAANRP